MLVDSESLVNTLEKLIAGQRDLSAYLTNKLTKIAAKEEKIQALLEEADRKKRLLQQADELAADYKNEEKPSLYGALLGVKDIFHVDGFLTRAGSNLPASILTGPEGKLITNLKELGLLILGKTVTTEFAYFHPGPTRNPHNTDHTPGGSSSGSAAAVAAGYCPLALGTQTIGSIIRPAAFCGVVGFKPSYERIPAEDLLLFSPSVDQVGFFTSAVEDINLVFSALVDDCQEEFKAKNYKELTENKKPVLGVPRGPYLEQLSPAGQVIFKKQIKYLSHRGYKIKEIKTLSDIKNINQSHQRLIAREFAKIQEEWYKEYKDIYRQQTRELIELGQEIDYKIYQQDKAVRLSLRSRLQQKMKDSEIDLWLAPSAPGPAPQGLASTGDPALNLPWTNAGLPVINLPAGKFANQLPAGLQIIGEFRSDEKLLSWALKLEEDLEQIKNTILPKP